MLRISRTNTGPVGEWWFTVDRYMLFGIIFLGLSGLFFSLAVSPVEAGHLKANQYYFLIKQSVFLLISVTLMITISILPKEFTRKISLILFIFSLLGVLLTLIIGLSSGGASRWISVFGIITIQPSEFLKPCLIILSAWFFARSKEEQNSKYSLIPGLLFILVATLLMLQPDLGQTILLFITILCLVFVQGFPWLIIAPAGLVSMISIIFFYFNFPHFASRLDSWIEIWFGGGAANSKLTQTQAAIDAIENGQIFGKGIGESWVKYHLPDAYTDFVFAAIAEESGLIVTISLMILYLILIMRGLIRSMNQNNFFNQLASSGLIILFGLQALIHIAVNLSLIPAKGMTLPFISYGGSSLLAMGITMGMFLALTKKTNDFKTPDKLKN
jgi:cell division protein FtsW|tara:strand:- start:871 stop:2028 length:1158 start_codon:yes stop_codon:yes gene_type:complete